MHQSSRKASLPPNKHVQIIETEASIRCGLTLSTTYELVVELCQIVLQRDHKVLFVWPFKHIRRYGYTNNSFSIEAGSKCATGEGLFIFRSPQSIQLYNQTIANVAKLKQFRVNHTKNQLIDEELRVALPGDSPTTPTPSDSNPLGRVSCELDTHSRHSTCTLAVPHYVRNNCEYAVVKRTSSRDYQSPQLDSPQDLPSVD